MSDSVVGAGVPRSPQGSPGAVLESHVTRWGRGIAGWTGGLGSGHGEEFLHLLTRAPGQLPHTRRAWTQRRSPPPQPGPGTHLRGHPACQPPPSCASEALDTPPANLPATPRPRGRVREAGRPRPHSPACVDFLRAFLMSSSVLLLSLISSCWVFISRSLCRSVRAFRAWGPTTQGSYSRGSEPGRPRPFCSPTSLLLGKGPLFSPCSWTFSPAVSRG